MSDNRGRIEDLIAEIAKADHVLGELHHKLAGLKAEVRTLETEVHNVQAMAQKNLDELLTLLASGPVRIIPSDSILDKIVPRKVLIADK